MWGAGCREVEGRRTHIRTCSQASQGSDDVCGWGGGRAPACCQRVSSGGRSRDPCGLPVPGFCSPCLPNSHHLGLCWGGKSSPDRQTTAGPVTGRWQPHEATAGMLLAGGQKPLEVVVCPPRCFPLCHQTVKRTCRNVVASKHI